MNYILSLIPEYGYVLVFVLLTVELMGVPFLPGEILLIYCGSLVFSGKLNIILLSISAIFGVCTGLTASYFIGYKLGEPFFKKYGSKIHLGPERVDKIANLLNKYGMALITFICFIPGLKHVIGYFSGISSMSYKKYAIGAYLGAVIWSMTFIMLGDLLGNNWAQFHTYMIKYLIIGATIAIILISIFYVLKIYRVQIISFLESAVIGMLRTFHSLGKIRIVVIISAITCVLLIDAFINIIQGLLSNQFEPFNQITYYIVRKIFANSIIFNPIFKGISILELNIMYIIISIITIIFIVYKSKYKKVEIKYTLITIFGGYVLGKILLYVFKFLSTYIKVFSNIFNTSCFNVVIIYGFLFYIIIRIVNKKIWSKILLTIFVLMCILAGIAQLFFGNTLSEILAGYSLGGAWLTINIVLLEVNKILPDIKSDKKE